MGVSCFYCSKPCKEPNAEFTEAECLANYRGYYTAHCESGIKVSRIYHTEIPEGWEVLKDFCNYLVVTKASIEARLKKGVYSEELHYLKPTPENHRKGVTIILPPEVQKAIEEELEKEEDKKYEDQKLQELYTKQALKVPTNVEELRRLHPLVKNDRFFNPLYFPDLTLREID